MKRLLLTLALVAAASNAPAAPDAKLNPGDPRIEAVRSLIAARDIDGLEAFLGSAQARYLDDALHADDMRRIFTAFTTTDPKMIAFTRSWLRARPASPYAQAARGWALNSASWIIRGEEIARATYPEALHQFSLMQDEAQMLAARAYAAAPDLIPISDLVIAVANGSGHKAAALDALDHVMTTRPNWGTL